MSETKPIFWKRKTYCLVTGASQGIGRQIAIDFARKVADGSTFLLLARNVDNLNETKRLMEQVQPNVNVLVHSFNFFEPVDVELRKIIGMSLMAFKQDPLEFDLAMIVHNAGSLGDLTESAYDMKNMEKLTQYFTLNLFSVLILNAEFLKVFDVKKRETDLDHQVVNHEQKSEICVLNITSLCGIKPFSSMGYYCMGKCSREMYFGVLAEENKDYVVLSYSPGPVLTEMTSEIIDTVRNEGLRESFIKMKAESTMLTTEKTIGRLVDVLDQRSFASGGRVDYFDG